MRKDDTLHSRTFTQCVDAYLESDKQVGLIVGDGN